MSEKVIDLKPCPFWFCGSSDIWVRSDLQIIAEYVECNTCGCRGPHKPTEAEAVEAWNKRALLKQPEPTGETCNDTGEVFRPRAFWVGKSMKQPCPNCKPEPTGEVAELKAKLGQSQGRHDASCHDSLGKIDKLEKQKSQLQAQLSTAEGEIKGLKEAFGLARSMVLSGEKMSPQAEEVFNQALRSPGERSEE